MTAKTVKATVLVRPETVATLDRIAEEELLGSRGRAIDWLARGFRAGTEPVP